MCVGSEWRHRSGGGGCQCQRQATTHGEIRETMRIDLSNKEWKSKRQKQKAKGARTEQQA